MFDGEFFTVDGGYVMYDHSPGAFRFACANDRNDPGVALEKAERLRLGLVLLQSVLTLDEQAILRGLVSIAEHRIHGPVAP